MNTYDPEAFNLITFTDEDNYQTSLCWDEEKIHIETEFYGRDRPTTLTRKQAATLSRVFMQFAETGTVINPELFQNALRGRPTNHAMQFVEDYS